MIAIQSRSLTESAEALLQTLHRDARPEPAASAMAVPVDADALTPPPSALHRRAGPEGPVTDGRYDHSLAEFPAFRFGKRRRGPDELIRFTDTVTAPNCPEKSLARTWTVYPSARWGYGGATTQATLFDLHQIWKVQGFRGTRIYFGDTAQPLPVPAPRQEPLDARLHTPSPRSRHPVRLRVRLHECLLGSGEPHLRRHARVAPVHRLVRGDARTGGRSAGGAALRLRGAERDLREDRPGARILRHRFRQRVLPSAAPDRAAPGAVSVEDVRVAGAPSPARSGAL